MRIDSSMQTQLSTNRFVELYEAFDDLDVPPRHPDPSGFVREELRRAGFSDKELGEVDLEVDPSGELALSSVVPLCEEIVRSTRWSLRRWRKTLEKLTSLAAELVDDDGGMPEFAKTLGDAAFRREVLENFGRIVEGVIVRMPLKRVSKPEQAVLCVLSSNETHNQLGRLWEEGGKRMSRRFWDRLEKHQPLLLFYLMKKADRGGRIELFAA